MSYSIRVITPPVNTAIERVDLRAHMRGSTGLDYDDVHITQLIAAATTFYERQTNTSLITQTLRLTLDSFDDVLYLPRGPVQSVSSVKYIDTNGVEQTLATSLYAVDVGHQPARIASAYDMNWPEARAQNAALTVDYVAGYGDSKAEVPADIKSALLMLATQYSDYQAASSEMKLHEVPFAVQSVIENRRMVEVV